MIQIVVANSVFKLNLLGKASKVPARESSTQLLVYVNE